MAKITYHKSHSFVDNNDVENTFMTQLYQIGVYGILNNNAAEQGSFTPQGIVKLEKNLEKAVKDKKIKSFELGIPITVESNKSGFWEEVIEEEIIDYPKSHTEDIKAVRGQGKTRKVVTIKAKKAFEQWGCEFFVNLTLKVTGFSNNYSITEKSTGLSIVNGESSEKKAIESAKNLLEDKGEKLFMEKIEEFKLEKYAKD